MASGGLAAGLVDGAAVDGLAVGLAVDGLAVVVADVDDLGVAALVCVDLLGARLAADLCLCVPLGRGCFSSESLSSLSSSSVETT